MYDINDKKYVAKKLKDIRRKLGYKQKEFAEILGVKPRTYQSYERAENMAKMPVLNKVAEMVNISIDDFFKEKEGEEKIKIKIPILGTVLGGHWIEPIEIEDYVTVPAKTSIPPRAFGLWVRGNSMEPTFPDGSLIFVDPKASYKNGDPCVVRLNGEVNFKRFYKYENKVVLEPENKKYSPIVINGNTELTFVGKVIGKLSKIEVL